MYIKNYKIIIIIYGLSFFLVAGISISMNLSDGRKLIDSIPLMLITVIPFICSLIPLVKDSLLNISKNKNRWTGDIFTDRKDDLTHLIEILCTQDHQIEIKGHDDCCGKTWLAMRLCDYINNPKDKSFGIEKKKLPYKRAFYIDLNTKKIEDFFSLQIIGAKDVLICDHVEDINKIIDKQKIYHFQMVYIMKKSSEFGFSSHYVSKFNIEDMELLHNKMRNTYPNLEELSKKEFNKLYDLTDGNIGRISVILSEQRCVSWLKDIANGNKTEYDSQLYKIQIELFSGHYKKAEQMLEEFHSEYHEIMKTFLDINYKYLLMLSDCKHLLNYYEDALNILSVVESTRYRKYERNNEISLHKAHYYKHLWESDVALDVLSGITSVSYSALVDSLGILAAKYFVDDLHVSISEKNTIETYKDYYVRAENSRLAASENDIHKLLRYKPLYKFYTQKNISLKELVSDIDEVITIYKAENNRLLANAYFIKGEIYRMFNKYDNAVIHYKKCLSVSCDNNIRIQTNLMMYYLKLIKKISNDFELLDSQQITELCEKNKYANKLYHRIQCIELRDPVANNIIKCFDTRMMPIL